MGNMKNTINMTGAKLIGYDSHKHAIWQKDGDIFSVGYDAASNACKFKAGRINMKVEPPKTWEDVRRGI
jgi:hypothetical protein